MKKNSDKVPLFYSLINIINLLDSLFYWCIGPVQDLFVEGSIEQLTDPDELLLVDLSVFGEHQTRVNHANIINHSMIGFVIITNFKKRK